MSFYTTLINKHLSNLGRQDIDADRVEDLMRLQYHTLDHLDPETFRKEVELCVECIDYEKGAR